MKTAGTLFIVLTSLGLAPAAFAQAQAALDKAKVKDILDQLTSKSQRTWISAGTIEATHVVEGAPSPDLTEADLRSEYQERLDATPSIDNAQEDPHKLLLDAIPFNIKYRLENTYKMTTTEVVTYDGTRFHWDIDVVDRSDSVPLDPALRGNYMVDHWEEHKDWNEHRTFAWDGEEYTLYSAPATGGGTATVDVAGMLGTPIVTGPLTAGLIPWGNGKLSPPGLLVASVAASQVALNGALSIRMSIAHPDGSHTDVDLDPSKAYAATFAKFTGTDGSEVTYTLGNHELHGDRWIPGSIIVERKNRPKRSKAPAREQWTIKSVSTAVPSPSSFDVPLALNATVEYLSPTAASSAIYTNSYNVDTDDLLAQRLAYALTARRRPQNCATAALQYVASAFGKSASPAGLARLVGPQGGTQLRDMQQYAQSLGLYTRLVKGDLETLRNLGAAKAILHLPGKEHFVVLDCVDGRDVWLIDLSSKNFYYRQSTYSFPMAWSAGTALLVSDRPIGLQIPDLPETTVQTIAGGYWDCNKLWQEADWLGCTYLWGLCMGTYTYYPERWVCTVVESGVCNTSNMPQRWESPCIPDVWVDCMPSGYWYAYTMRACQ